MYNMHPKFEPRKLKKLSKLNYYACNVAKVGNSFQLYFLL